MEFQAAEIPPVVRTASSERDFQVSSQPGPLVLHGRHPLLVAVAAYEVISKVTTKLKSIFLMEMNILEVDGEAFQLQGDGPERGQSSEMLQKRDPVPGDSVDVLVEDYTTGLAYTIRACQFAQHVFVEQIHVMLLTREGFKGIVIHAYRYLDMIQTLDELLTWT